MKKRIISAIILVIGLSYSLYQEKSEVINSDQDSISTPKKSSDFNFLPTSTTGVIIKHNGYNLSYSEKHEQAEWVAYSLDKSDIVYSNRKRPFFIEDQIGCTGSSHTVVNAAAQKDTRVQTILHATPLCALR